jgi:hypothetical protein
MLVANEMKEFQELEDNFNIALTTNKTNTIESYLSDDWFILEPSFGLITKENFLKAINSGDLSHSAMKKEVALVRRHDDIAIVTSRGWNVGMYKNETFKVEIWVTNIYKRKGNDWICIMTQESPVNC